MRMANTRPCSLHTTYDRVQLRRTHSLWIQFTLIKEIRSHWWVCLAIEEEIVARHRSLPRTTFCRLRCGAAHHICIRMQNNFILLSNGRHRAYAIAVRKALRQTYINNFPINRVWKTPAVSWNALRCDNEKTNVIVLFCFHSARFVLPANEEKPMTHIRGKSERVSEGERAETVLGLILYKYLRVCRNVCDRFSLSFSALHSFSLLHTTVQSASCLSGQECNS